MMHSPTSTSKLCLIFLGAAPLLLLLLSLTTAKAELVNVKGTALQQCSQSGMAQTGYTRTGSCVDHTADDGSHHVCIDLSSTTGGNFCSVTGQSNWCGGQMPCDNNLSEDCSVQNWCVCEWAFASYLSRAGGCDKIASVVCESTNEKVVLHYQAKISDGDEKAKVALMCLKEKCELDISI